MLNALENEYAAANEKQETNSNNNNITSYNNNNINQNNNNCPLSVPFCETKSLVREPWNKSIIRFNFYSICGSALLLHWFTNPVNNLLQSIYLPIYIYIHICIYILNLYKLLLLLMKMANYALGQNIHHHSHTHAHSAKPFQISHSIVSNI